MKSPSITVLIPVYNHGSRIAGVVQDVMAKGYDLLVVDDGSTDSTREKVENIPGVPLLIHEENRGKGAALMTGFRALKDGCRWVLTIDGDGQHSVDDIEVFIREIERDPEPRIICGYRQGMDAEDVPWTSSFGRKFSNFWVRLSGGPSIRDSQSGLRLYPLPESAELNVKSKRYQFEIEVLVLARWKGIPVTEVPVQVSYQEGERISHFKPWTDFWRNAATFARLITMRILLFLPLRRRISFL